MDISPNHNDARLLVIRTPALQASLDLLVWQDPYYSYIEIYDGVKPSPGVEPTTQNKLVTIPLTSSAGVVNGAPDYQIILAVPVEGQITGADPVTGSIPTWARIYTARRDDGVTHKVDFDTGVGTFSEAETLTFGNGATATLVELMDNLDGSGVMFLELLTGTLPPDNDTISGATSFATAAVNGSVEHRGGWWADCTATVAGGSGEIQLAQTGEEGGQPVARYYNGAFARITSAIFQG